VTLSAVTVLGFLLGVRHATDADHVVAITTIICRERTPRAAMLVGGLWGIGHTVTILIVGGAIILFGLVIPPRIGVAMELLVSAMLIVLGLMNLTGAGRRIRSQVQVHAHAHAHAHDHDHDHDHAGPDAAAHVAAHARAAFASVATLRPLAIGVVHGLAGSAAIALLVLTTIRDPARSLIYLGVFGGGTVLGMMFLTTAMMLPIALAARRFGSLEAIMARVTGAISLAFGLFLIYQVGFAGVPG
jgi:ABC-type nickel/cobalt efflux system permease component RcnA